MKERSMPQRYITAAVVRQAGGPFGLEPVTLRGPGTDEVIVEVKATGMCHADIVVRDQQIPTPLPLVLGHEGAGVVVEKGSDVRNLDIGDHVVLSFAYCGHCAPCSSGHPPYCEYSFPLNFGGVARNGSHALTDSAGHPLHDHFFGQSSFATYAVCNQRNAVRVRKDVRLESLGPLGCGVQTGAGAVMNSLNVRPQSSFAVYGAGAVGLSALLAAKARGASTLIAVDIVAERLEMARELGTTHVIDGRAEGALTLIKDASHGGVDFSLDTSGVPTVIEQASAALAPMGRLGLVTGFPGTKAAFDINSIFQGGRTIRGIVQGDSLPHQFIPYLIDLHVSGDFPFDKLIRYYEFADINQAAADSHSGKTVKPVIRVGR
jgi:aryl-alcohol dehydrogenase